MQHLSSSPAPSLLLLDIRMPRLDGLEVLSELENQGRRIPSVIVSGVDEVPTVVKAMQLGAVDYLMKPLDDTDLEEAIGRALRHFDEANGVRCMPPDCVFRSLNKRMLRLRELCDHVAQTDVPILILGESGVGKEVVARYVHEKAGSRKPFVKVNCAALPADLLESEMFGHERGAFTGAHREKPGKFELAGRGSIMLDEVAEMSPLLQAKLLHVLQDGEYSRLGGTRTLTSQARIIAATNKELRSMVAAGRFREDLYFRLNVIAIEIPPLRERREDIPQLCGYFLERYAAKYNHRIKTLPPQLSTAFQAYSWPGNVRELENAVKRFLILPNVDQAMAELTRVEVSAVSDRKPPVREEVCLKELSAHAAEKTEKELIFSTLRKVNWNRKQAAKELHICYKSLLNKLHRWQLQERTGSDGDEEVERKFHS